MTEIRTFPPPEAERRYVESARALFLTTFPGQEFDALRWNVEHLRKRSHKSSNANVYWTLYGSQKDPLPPPFADVIKAVCVLDLQSASNMVFRSDAARILWNALIERMDVSEFQWVKVGVEDLLRAEQLMREVRKSPGTTYKCFSSFSRVLDLLATHRIMRPLQVRWATPRPEDSERYTLDGRAAREEYMPSDAAIDAAADIYYRHAETPQDRILACAVAILLATGLRIGEILALPRDPLIRIADEWRLQYWLEKSKRYERVTLSLTDLQAELVAEAVAEIHKITADARLRARETERTGGLISLPGEWRSHEEISGTDLGAVLGLDRGSVNAIPKEKLARRVVTNPGARRGEPARAAMFRVADAEAYLAREQGPLWTIRDHQPLSESLFVVFKNFMHARKGTNPLLVECIREQQMNDFLNGRHESCAPEAEDAVLHEGKPVRWLVRSAFDRFGLTEKDGQPIELTTHSFRHYVNTKVLEHGGADSLVARWQNRAYNADLAAYNHVKDEHRLTLLRNGITSGRIVGELAEMYFTIAEDLRDAFLDTVVQHVQVTDVGFCVHDYSAEPCPFHLNCLRGCKDYLVDPTDQPRRARLLELAERTQTVLEAEEKQAAETGQAVSESWVASHRQLLTNIDRILNTPARPGCRFSQPFSDATSNFVEAR